MEEETPLDLFDRGARLGRPSGSYRGRRLRLRPGRSARGLFRLLGCFLVLRSLRARPRGDLLLLAACLAFMLSALSKRDWLDLSSAGDRHFSDAEKL